MTTYRITHMRLDSTREDSFRCEAESPEEAQQIFWADREATDPDYRDYLAALDVDRSHAGGGKPQCPIEIIRTERVKLHGSRWHAVG